MGPTDEQIRKVLTSARTIAVVGMSDKPNRDSYQVAGYLKGQGYRIVPVNPLLSEVLGERSYPSVADIPPEIRVDVVDVFRRSEQVPPVMEEAIARSVPVVWMQQGISNPESAARGRAAGITVFEDLCMMSQHRRLRLGPVGVTP
jgi:predicted CoA-binding protein